jgi:hypothetical protein
MPDHETVRFLSDVLAKHLPPIMEAMAAREAAVEPAAEKIIGLLEQILAALSAPAAPALPVSIDLWDMTMIARYLKRSPSQVRERIVIVPSFPKSIRLPVANGGRSNPLYKARDVIQWAEQHQAG